MSKRLCKKDHDNFSLKNEPFDSAGGSKQVEIKLLIKRFSASDKPFSISKSMKGVQSENLEEVGPNRFHLQAIDLLCTSRH